MVQSKLISIITQNRDAHNRESEKDAIMRLSRTNLRITPVFTVQRAFVFINGFLDIKVISFSGDITQKDRVHAKILGTVWFTVTNDQH